MRTQKAQQEKVQSDYMEEARRQMMHGLAWCVGGIVVTAVSLSAAMESGGTYIVAIGAIFWGGKRFFTNLARVTRGGR